MLPSDLTEDQRAAWAEFIRQQSRGWTRQDANEIGALMAAEIKKVGIKVRPSSSS